MIKQKEQDWVLNLIGNPELTVSDLHDSGLTADNTSFQSENVYKANEKIRNAEMFKNDKGEFDESKFHTFYQNAAVGYNSLSNKTRLKKYDEQAVRFGMDNMFAKPEQRKTWKETVQYGLSPNPDRTTTGLIRVGETTAPTMSAQEIAQTQSVLKNPVAAAANIAKGIFDSAEWGESPNDSWLKEFFNGPKVLATWDDKGTHIDPITGETIHHEKGEKKLNENGTYYYEELDGRDVYGKQVLNNLNILTTDGSWANRHLDFFDSDDIESSPGKTLLKNAALVGTMFLPYVGPWVAGLSVATQTVGMLGTLGKMLSGSNSPTFSWMEGWASSFNRQTAKSDYAMEHTFCLENFINLIGDVAGQLREQRFIFDFVPALYKGNKVLGWNGITKKTQDKFVQQATEEITRRNALKLSDLMSYEGRNLSATELGFYHAAQESAGVQAQAQLNNFMKEYQKIGEVLSKGYMTALTVGDTYGELKEAGASDFEATAFTLGYAAAEAALLNTGVGDWILPEKHGDSIRRQEALKAFANANNKFKQEAATGNWKNPKAAFNYIFNLGKNTANTVADISKSTLTRTAAAGLGEGVEEVSEELLADFTKGAYNTLQALKGTEDHQVQIDNIRDRYLMSFLGGAIGGGLTNVGTNFRLAQKGMTSEAARQQIVYDLKEGKLDEYLKTLDSLEGLGDKNLSFQTLGKDASGNPIYEAANDPEQSQEAQIKQAFRDQLTQINSIIHAEGLAVRDNEFINKNTFNDIRIAALSQSTMTNRYIQDFLQNASAVVDKRLQIKDLEDKYTDGQTMSDADLEEKSKLESELKILRERNQSMLNGDAAMDYISKALMDLTPLFSNTLTQSFFSDYVQEMYHKKVSELSPEEYKTYHEEFDQWKQNEYQDKITVLAPTFLNMVRNSKDFIEGFTQNYDKIRKHKSLQDLIRKREEFNVQLTEDYLQTENDEEKENLWLNKLGVEINREGYNTLLTIIEHSNPSLRQSIRNIQNLINQTSDESQRQQFEFQSRALAFNDIINNFDRYYGEFFNTGVINPDIKRELTHSLNTIKTFSNATLQVAPFLKNALGVEQAIMRDVPDYEADQPFGAILDIDDNAGGMIGESPADLVKSLFNTPSLESVINQAQTFLNAINDPRNASELTLKELGELYNEVQEKNVFLDEQIHKLNELPYTDTIQYITQFIQANSDSKLDFPKLLETIDTLYNDNSTDLSSIEFDSYIPQVEEAIRILDLLRTVTLAAQSNTDASIGNMLGYNKTLNEIAKDNHARNWEALPEISEDVAQVINQDLNLLKNKLENVKRVYEINSGKKLNKQSKAAINKHFIDYNALRKFVVNIDDSWAGKDELAQTLSESSLLSQFAETRDQSQLTPQQKEELEVEKIKIDDGIYNFFQANKEKIKKGDLKHLLKNKGLNLYNLNKNLINENTDHLEDRDLLWYLASRAAIKRSAFNNEWRQTIDIESGKAPLFTQEEATFVNLASILNGDIMSKFADAAYDTFKEDFEGKSESERVALIKNWNDEHPQDKIHPSVAKDTKLLETSRFRPRFSNIVFTEGIPGAGKTDAVDKFTTDILKKFHQDYLKKVFVVHTNLKNAEDLNGRLDIPDSVAKSKTDLLKFINSKYNENREKDETGRNIYTQDEFKSIDGVLKYQYTADAHSAENLPSLIIIDELSLYDEAELQMINDFAKRHGITVLASGDYDQSIQDAIYYSDAAKTEKNSYTLTPHRDFFIGSSKLGVSMRTANAQMDKTITAFQARKSASDDINTYYYEDNNVLNGVKVINNITPEAIKKEIDDLVKKSKGDISFIYYNDNSEILKYIKANYADVFKINDPKESRIYKGSAAQGLEGKYFIMDAKNDIQDRDIYTAITRSSQGTLVFNTGDVKRFKTHQEGETHISKQPIEAYKKYAQKRKDFLDRINEGDEVIEEYPRTPVDPEVKEADPTADPKLNTDGDPEDTPPPPDPIAVKRPLTPPVISKKPLPDQFWSEIEFTVNVNGAPIKSNIISLSNPAGETTGIFATMVDIDGLNVPFIFNTSNNTWELSSGVTDTGVLNSSELQLPIITAIVDYLNGEYPDPANETIIIDKDIDGIKDEEDAEQKKLDWITSTLKGDLNIVTSDNKENLITENEKLIQTHIDEIPSKYLSIKDGAEVKVTNCPKITEDGIYKVTIEPNADNFNYVFTKDGSKPIALDYKYVEEHSEWFSLDTSSLPTWKNPSEIQLIDYNHEQYACDGELVIYKNGDSWEEVTDPNLKETIKNIWESNNEGSQDDETKSDEIIQDDVAANNGRNSGAPMPQIYNYTWHQFNSYEMGMIADDKDKITYQHPTHMLHYEKRIDSALGLVKIYENDWKKPQKTFEFYQKKIIKLHQNLVHAESKQELVDALNQIFQDISDTENITVSKVDFGLISTYPHKIQADAEKPKFNDFEMFSRFEDEETFGDATDKTIMRKSLSAAITLSNGKRVTIPLFSMGNINTLMFNPTSAEGQYLTGVKQAHADDAYKYWTAVANNKQFPRLAKMAKMFLFTGQAWFPIKNDDWLPETHLHNYGVQINTGSVSGSPTPYSRRITSINQFKKENPHINISQKVYTSLQGINLGNDVEQYLANRGHSFIMVSTYPDIVTDADMQEQIYKQLGDPTEPKKVQIVYVIPPVVSVRQAIESQIKILKSGKRANVSSSLMTPFSVYNIWKNLDLNILNVDKATKEFIKKKLDEVTAIITDPDLKAEHRNITYAFNKLNEISEEFNSPEIAPRSLPKASLSSYLNSIMLQEVTDVTGHTNKDLLDNFIKAVENFGFTEYRTNFKFGEKKGSDKFFVEMNVDSNYQVEGLDVQMNCKLDPDMFIIGEEFDSIMDEWIDMIDDSDGYKSTETVDFIQESKPSEKDNSKKKSDDPKKKDEPKDDDPKFQISKKTLNFGETGSLEFSYNHDTKQVFVNEKLIDVSWDTIQSYEPFTEKDVQAQLNNFVTNPNLFKEAQRYFFENVVNLLKNPQSVLKDFIHLQEVAWLKNNYNATPGKYWYVDSNGKLDFVMIDSLGLTEQNKILREQGRPEIVFEPDIWTEDDVLPKLSEWTRKLKNGYVLHVKDGFGEVTGEQDSGTIITTSENEVKKPPIDYKGEFGFITVSEIFYNDIQNRILNETQNPDDQEALSAFSNAYKIIKPSWRFFKKVNCFGDLSEQQQTQVAQKLQELKKALQSIEFIDEEDSKILENLKEQLNELIKETKSQSGQQDDSEIQTCTFRVKVTPEFPF